MKTVSTADAFISPARVFACQPVLLPPEETCALCQRRYAGHPRGCPNYGHKQGCPPTAPHLTNVLDLVAPCMLVVVRFDLESFAARMKLLHSDWTDKQCRNSRYWQAAVMKRLRHAAKSTAVISCKQGEPPRIIAMVPEAHGVNVTETCKLCGVHLEWPPTKYVHKVALIGRAKSKEHTT